MILVIHAQCPFLQPQLCQTPYKSSFYYYYYLTQHSFSFLLPQLPFHSSYLTLSSFPFSLPSLVFLLTHLTFYSFPLTLSFFCPSAFPYLAFLSPYLTLPLFSSTYLILPHILFFPTYLHFSSLEVQRYASQGNKATLSHKVVVTQNTNPLIIIALKLLQANITLSCRKEPSQHRTKCYGDYQHNFLEELMTAHHRHNKN